DEPCTKPLRATGLRDGQKATVLVTGVDGAARHHARLAAEQEIGGAELTRILSRPAAAVRWHMLHGFQEFVRPRRLGLDLRECLIVCLRAAEAVDRKKTAANSARPLGR